jgi:hypothetical protein
MQKSQVPGSPPSPGPQTAGCLEASPPPGRTLPPNVQTDLAHRWAPPVASVAAGGPEAGTQQHALTAGNAPP